MLGEARRPVFVMPLANMGSHMNSRTCTHAPALANRWKTATFAQ